MKENVLVLVISTPIVMVLLPHKLLDWYALDQCCCFCARKSSSAFTCLMYEEILQKRMLDRVLQKMLFIHAMACRMSGNKLVLDVLVLLLS